MSNETNDIAVIESSTIGSTAMMFGAGNFDRAMQVAEAMANAVVSVPVHFRGKPGDCLAIVMQAAQWNMNPFAVAQKTHLSQSGALGYEAQLVNAVVVSSGALKSQPEFRFIGDWSRVLGKVEERKSDKGGKYYVATYTKSDEEGLGVICSARLRGEAEPREITVMLSQCYPRFSTQWATDPQQQITYVAVRKFARRYTPGAILGVYTPEELDDPAPRDMGTIDRETGEVTPPAKQALPPCPDTKIDRWIKNVEDGKAQACDLMAFAKAKYTLTDVQEGRILTFVELQEKPPIDGDFVEDMEKAEQGAEQ
jgi:hypothetical protein